MNTHIKSLAALALIVTAATIMFTACGSSDDDPVVTPLSESEALNILQASYWEISPAMSYQVVNSQVSPKHQQINFKLDWRVTIKNDLSYNTLPQKVTLSAAEEGDYSSGTMDIGGLLALEYKDLTRESFKVRVKDGKTWSKAKRIDTSKAEKEGMQTIQGWWKSPESWNGTYRDYFDGCIRHVTLSAFVTFLHVGKNAPEPYKQYEGQWVLDSRENVTSIEFNWHPESTSGHINIGHGAFYYFNIKDKNHAAFDASSDYVYERTEEISAAADLSNK